ncbi:MarR family winged helix-turn-helix transcriptional regulator [Pyramidobacter sp.]|uniref:MarR family winged helix-turn-helix transcriptional regulator n=1 Tax=Pyramidobacter sp. TaxID=1943581 RepID=UPI002A760580|nr:MarR family transcriptional regulator [Pyramidobacter sp.]MDY3212501.1 MarR family transcriptional regulator [Pyramidobacter sp.]
MGSNTKDYLTRIAMQEKQFDALYRETSTKFDLPDCAMWVLYFLVSSDGPITQQDLIEKMMFPKQTINSAVMKLSKEGLVQLQIIPGTRNRTTIFLTDTGAKLAQATVERMRHAELRAVEAMGAERMEQFVSLHNSFYSHLQRAFQDEGLTDA